MFLLSYLLSEKHPTGFAKLQSRVVDEYVKVTDIVSVHNVEQIDHGREHSGSQLPRPQQLTIAGSPTCVDDDAQMSLKKSDAISAEQAHVDRYGARSAGDARTRPADETGIIDTHSSVCIAGPLSVLQIAVQ